MAIICLHERNQQKNRRILSMDSARRKLIFAILPKWICLLLLVLLILYRDTKSLSACILINSRQATTTDIQKYLSSVVEGSSSGRSGVFLLRRRFGETGSKLDRRTKPSQQGKLGLSIDQNYNGHHQNLTTDMSSEGKFQNKSDSTEETTQVLNNGPSHPSIKPPATKIEQKLQSDITFQQIPTSLGNSEKLTLSESNTQADTITRTDTSTFKKVRVLCLSGESYGRTMNQYIQLAVLLHQLGVNGTSVVAFKNPFFNRFFKEWFDPRDDVLVDYDENALCDAEYDAATLHYLFFEDKWKQVAYQFKTLIPKASIRAEAELAMKDYSGPFNTPVTTVHRRDLEGACVLFAKEMNLLACPNTLSSLELDVSDYKNACLIDYPMIANETLGTKVVLFTDSQVPDLDETFPIVSNHSFPVQSWMMAKSAVHYGNPFSTVDVVVYYWRMAFSEGNDNVNGMRPTACYRPTPNSD
jgi:hypothetical protein